MVGLCCPPPYFFYIKTILHHSNFSWLPPHSNNLWAANTWQHWSDHTVSVPNGKATPLWNSKCNPKVPGWSCCRSLRKLVFFSKLLNIKSWLCQNFWNSEVTLGSNSSLSLLIYDRKGRAIKVKKLFIKLVKEKKCSAQESIRQGTKGAKSHVKPTFSNNT